jgi:hypothetical protein
MDNTQIKSKLGLEKIFGIILLIPPLLSVLLFLLNVLTKYSGKMATLSNLSDNWTGGYNYSQGGGGGYTSAAPIYLGLMAIAGAILLKGTDNK